MERDIFEGNIKDLYGMEFTLKVAEEVSKGKKIDYPEFRRSIEEYNGEHGTRIGPDHVLVCSIQSNCHILTQQLFDPVMAELRESAENSEDKGVAEVIRIMISAIKKLRNTTQSGKLQ